MDSMDKRDAYSIVFSSCKEVQNICKDFFKLTGLTYFNFIRVYDDLSRVCLSNNESWMRYVLNHHADYDLVFEETNQHLHANFLIWDLIDELKTDKLLNTAKNKFNIAHGATLISCYETFTEFYYFATTTDNSKANLFYINNQDLLQAFLLYIKDRARLLIKKAEERRLQLSGHTLFWLGKKDNNETNNNISKFMEKCDIDKYFLNGNMKSIHLSVREAECLTYLFDGKSPKEIGQILGISHRTVETHVKNTKLKLSCSHRSDLLEKARKHGFSAIYNVIKAQNQSN